MSKGQTLQDPFLNSLRKERIPVSIFLVNGIKLQGQIESFDQYVVLLKNTVSQMVYKHAISTVVPARNPRPAGSMGPGSTGAGFGGPGGGFGGQGGGFGGQGGSQGGFGGSQGGFGGQGGYGSQGGGFGGQGGSQGGFGGSQGGYGGQGGFGGGQGGYGSQGGYGGQAGFDAPGKFDDAGDDEGNNQ